MQPDLQSIILLSLQALGGIFCVVIGFNYKDLKTKVEANIKEIDALKLHCSETYPTKNDLMKSFEAIFKKLDKIEDKLDRKQDKP